MSESDAPIRVKLLSKGERVDAQRWLRQVPGGSLGEARWGACVFSVERDDRAYDWLVVYDELPASGELLACPREHTLLVTAEPASIKVYGKAYLSQFGHVLSSQEPFAIPHPGHIHGQPGLRWFYGLPHRGDAEPRGYEAMEAEPGVPKDGVISTVCSAKAMGHTLHGVRYGFTQELKAAVPELEVFGWGVREMADKAEALDGYRYHVAIENHRAPHHITEKLTDVFLGECLPLYFGAPNAAEYFPEESFIPIDIREAAGAIETVRRAVRDDEYSRRLPAIREAKRRVLEEHNLFAVLARQIERLDTGRRSADGGRLVNRRRLRWRDPVGGVGALVERWRVRRRLRRLR